MRLHPRGHGRVFVEAVVATFLCARPLAFRVKADLIPTKIEQAVGEHRRHLLEEIAEERVRGVACRVQHVVA